MESFKQDIRFAFRTLRGARGTAAIAIICLALGIGANTAIFSVVHAVLLESLPYGEPARLVKIDETFMMNGARVNGSVAPPNYSVLRDQTRLFASVAAYARTTRDLGDVAHPEHLLGLRVTPNLFGVLGARPIAGRTFIPADSEPGAPLAVVISEALWRRSFGARANLIGSPITLSSSKFVVLGVMPSAFDFPVATTHTDFWTLIDWKSIGGTSNRRNHSLQVVARLATGMDSAAATAGLEALARTLARDFPDAQAHRGLHLASLADNVVGKIRPALLVLLGAVGLVLLIACANVANLLLARAAGRRRELAIRTALGAARARLVRQMLTESVLLALAGGLLGIVIARLSMAALSDLATNTLPRADSISLNATVLCGAFAVSLATGLLFGVIPALGASKTELRNALSDAAGRSSAGAARHRTLNLLISAEIALSLVLLVGAGLVIRSFVALVETDPGFKPERVLTFHAAPPAAAIADSVRYTQFYGAVLDRLRSTPDVRTAAFTSILPIEDGPTDRYFGIEGRAVDSTNIPDAQMRVVSSDYFRALGIPVLAGREFDDRDDLHAPYVVVINDELARRYFPHENPIGQRLQFNGVPLTIAGVVKAVRQVSLEQSAEPEFYLAAPQFTSQIGSVAFVLSTRGDPSALAPIVRAAMHDVAPQQPVYQLATMTGVISTSLSARRLVLLLLGVFALLALVLSAAGVYGVMSYAVLQRTREIGIRIALGARAGDVSLMVLRDAATVAASGLAAGLLAAVLLTRLLRGLVYGVGTHDPLTFAIVPAIIALVALAAATLPALRATRIDPLEAMRAD